MLDETRRERGVRLENQYWQLAWLCSSMDRLLHIHLYMLGPRVLLDIVYTSDGIVCQLVQLRMHRDGRLLGSHSSSPLKLTLPQLKRVICSASPKSPYAYPGIIILHAKKNANADALSNASLKTLLPNPPSYRLTVHSIHPYFLPFNILPLPSSTASFSVF